MTDSKQPTVLITGLPRSGTTWLVQSLNLHPKILAFGETHFFSKRWIHPSQNGRYSSSELDAVWKTLANCPFWSSTPLKKDLGKSPGWFSRTSFDDLPEVIASARRRVATNPTPAEVLDAVGQAFCEREGKRFWVEKTASEGKNVLSTARKMSDARFILTMREPMGFFRSYKFQGAQMKKDLRDMYAARYHPFLAAVVWRLTFRNIRKARSKYPDRVSVLNLSDDQARRHGLQEICRFVGVEPDEAMYALLGKKVNSSDTTDDVRSLDRADLAWIRYLCRVDEPGLRIGEDLSDIGFLDLLKSIAGIPAWMLRFLYNSSSWNPIPFRSR